MFDTKRFEMKYRPLANQCLLNMTPLKASPPPSPPFLLTPSPLDHLLDLPSRKMEKSAVRLVMTSNVIWLLVKTKERVAMAGKSMPWIWLCQMILS